MTGFDAVLFDNGDTLFHKPVAPPAIARIAASLGRPIDEPTAVDAYAAMKARSRAIEDQDLVFGRNRSSEGHYRYYTTCYEPLDEIVPGLADAFYRDFKTNPESMIPYPDSEATLRALHEAGLPIGIVSNTGWNIRRGYVRAGLDVMIGSYVLSFEHGMAKPEPAMWALACKELEVDPKGVLMVGNNPRADSGAVELGCTALVLPPVGRGQQRGLEAVLHLVGLQPVPAAATAATD